MSAEISSVVAYSCGTNSACCNGIAILSNRFHHKCDVTARDMRRIRCCRENKKGIGIYTTSLSCHRINLLLKISKLKSQIICLVFIYKIKQNLYKIGQLYHKPLLSFFLSFFQLMPLTRFACGSGRGEELPVPVGFNGFCG